MEVQFGIVVPDAVAHPVAVVVHQVDTPSASPAVVVTLWLQSAAHLTLPLLLSNLLLTNAIALGLLMGPQPEYQPGNID